MVQYRNSNVGERCAGVATAIQGHMVAPLVGKRVVVDGLASKPELNGSKGTATSFDDAKGRYNLKMDAGGMLALKPANVLPDRSAGGVPGFNGLNGDRAGGGVPGFGGMPGMGGMGGGAGGIAALLAQLLQRAKGAGGLPFGLTPQQLGLGGLALCLGVRALGLGMVHGLLVGGLLLGADRAPGGGERGLERAAGALGRLSGRPVTHSQAGVVLAAALLLGVRFFLGGGGGVGVGGAAGGGSGGGYEAYTKGFNDGQAPLSYSPVAPTPYLLSPSSCPQLLPVRPATLAPALTRRAESSSRSPTPSTRVRPRRPPSGAWARCSASGCLAAWYGRWAAVVLGSRGAHRA
jgi:hypothetical protein